MTRTLKNTRIKGIPARIQLSERDNTTSSLYESMYNDLNTVVYGQNTLINAGYNVDNSNLLLTDSEYSTDIEYSGSLKRGIADNFIQHVSSTVSSNIEPFKEVNLIASDMKSYGSSSFFNEGTSIQVAGIGLSEPLWSKTKFEIDLGTGGGKSGHLYSYMAIDVSQSVEMDLSPSYTGSNYFLSSSYNLPDPIFPMSPMSYYNFSEKFWEPIGRGIRFFRNNRITNGYSETALKAAKYATIGFMPGLINLHMIDPRNLTASNAATVLSTSVVLAENLPKKMFEYHKCAGHYTDQYGFPFAAKYHAKDEQHFDVSALIDRPFILEKAVLVLSSVQYNGPSVSSMKCEVTGVAAPYTITNFFILNQRKKATFEYKPLISSGFASDTNLQSAIKEIPKLWTSPTSSIIKFNGNTETTDTIRDLIGYASIVCHTNDFTSSISRIVGSSFGPEFNSLPFYNGNFNQNQTWFYKFNLRDPSISLTDPATFVTESVSNPVSEFFKDRELIISTNSYLSNSFTNFKWEKEHLVLSFSMNSPVQTRNLESFIDPFSQYISKSSNNISSVAGINTENGGRNGLGPLNPTGRELINPQGSTENLDELMFYVKEDFFGYKTPYKKINDSNFKTNAPYILMPGDKLIFGWQLPVPKVINGSPINKNGSPENYTFPLVLSSSIGNTWLSYNNTSGGNSKLPVGSLTIRGPGKIILYGTYLDELPDDNGEYHRPDKSRRVLETNSIQEIIIGDE